MRSSPVVRRGVGWLVGFALAASSCTALAQPCLLYTSGSLALQACRSPDPAPTPKEPASSASVTATTTTLGDTRTLHALTMKRLDGSEVALSTYAGKVLLVVNTASECGYTPQYEGLEALHAKYAARGFSVLGFPSNDFGGQEPGTAPEIATFCKSKYGITFPMFEKVKTIGDERSALYRMLSDAKGPPKWNFHKYLVDKKGKVVASWPSAVVPASPEIAKAIDEQLTAQ